MAGLFRQSVVAGLVVLAGGTGWAQTGPVAPPFAPPPAVVVPGRAVAPSPFLDEVTAHFAAWDGDHNGVLSLDEINAVVSDPAVTGKTAAAAVALRRAMTSKTYTLPPVTPENLHHWVPRPADADPNLPRFEATYRTVLTRLTREKRALFATGTPHLESVHQGRLGDCFCLAPLGAMLHRDPQAVVKMFSVAPDGAVTVNFGGKEQVVLKPLTDSELASTATSTQDGIWVNLYEKAIGAYRVAHSKGEKKPYLLDDLTRGGSAGTIVALLTGHPIKRFSCAALQNPKTDAARYDALLADLRGMLISAIADKRLICAGTPKTVTVPGMTPNHAYAILDYDAAKDTLLIWNPHGNTFHPKGTDSLTSGYTTTGGQFHIPLADAVQFMGGFSLEQPASPDKALTPATP